jgi:hypothetical protein
MVKRSSVTLPDRAEDGDATAKCAELEPKLKELEGLNDPEADSLVTRAKRLCGLEVPLLNADLALKQVTNSPSQASRKLMCGFAQTDLSRARRTSPADRRLRDMDTRFARACR